MQCCENVKCRGQFVKFATLQHSNNANFAFLILRCFHWSFSRHKVCVYFKCKTESIKPSNPTYIHRHKSLGGVNWSGALQELSLMRVHREGEEVKERSKLIRRRGRSKIKKTNLHHLHFAVVCQIFEEIFTSKMLHNYPRPQKSLFF